MADGVFQLVVPFGTTTMDSKKWERALGKNAFDTRAQLNSVLELGSSRKWSMIVSVISGGRMGEDCLLGRDVVMVIDASIYLYESVKQLC